MWQHAVLELMPIVDRMERRLSTTLTMISQGAKLQLVHSVLSSLAVYACALSDFHKKLWNTWIRSEDFGLWSKKQGVETKCNSLAAWEMVCRPKEKGGLGVLDIKVQNTGLLLKQLHKFYNREDLPWVDLIWSTYYQNCGSLTF